MMYKKYKWVLMDLKYIKGFQKFQKNKCFENFINFTIKI